jgi:hypothetical protein
MTFDLYVWQRPREVDEDHAQAMLNAWHADGADPARSPFEQTTDMGWFYRELSDEFPDLDALTDAVPSGRRTPVWMSGTDEPPARLVAVRLSRERARDELESIGGLATKYDLVLYDARNRRLHRPLDEMAAYARSTFWPRGAIRAAAVGGIGLLAAIGSFQAGIPLLSGLLMIVGGFLFVLAVLTFALELWGRLRVA